MSTLLRPRERVEVDLLDPEVCLLAGGTDVLVQRRAGREFGPLADISNIVDAPPTVEWHEDEVRLSALAAISDVARELGTELPALRAAIACFASTQIRNRATLGGNLANASPAADTVPALVVAGALLTLRGRDGSRAVPVTEFAIGPGRTCLTPGEWIETVVVPRDHDPRPRQEGFRKIAGRRALAISIVSLAWSWRRSEDGRLSDVRLAAGAVAPVVVRCRRTEGVLEGRRADPGVVAAATDALAVDIAPIDDLRASAQYRVAAAGGALIEALVGCGAEPPDSTHPTENM